MKNKNNIVKIIAVIVIVIILGYFMKDRIAKKEAILEKQEEIAEEKSQQEEQEIASDGAPKGLIIGEKMKDFKSYDKDGKELDHKNIDGEIVTIDDFKGKITLVNFWASWCVYCEQEMPDLVKLQETYDDVEVVTINVGDSPEEAKAYMEDGGYDLELVLDEDGLLGQEFLISAFPATYFIDKEGIFMGRVPSMMTYEQMELIVGEIRENRINSAVK